MVSQMATIRSSPRRGADWIVMADDTEGLRYCGSVLTSSSHFFSRRLRSSEEPYFLKS